MLAGVPKWHSSVSHGAEKRNAEDVVRQNRLRCTNGVLVRCSFILGRLEDRNAGDGKTIREGDRGKMLTGVPKWRSSVSHGAEKRNAEDVS